MNVLIALASSSGQLSGVQRHAINVARCLLARTEVSAVHLVAAPWQLQFVEDALPQRHFRLFLHAPHIGNSAVSRNQWYYARLPALARSLKADLVHLAYPAPVQQAAYACPVIVTLHDLYPYDLPENFGFPKVLFNRLILRQCLNAADAIACVSEGTRSRLSELFPRFAGKASVISNAVEPALSDSASIPRPAWGSQPFLLCVAQHRRNKNIPVAIRALEQLLRGKQVPGETRLVIVGITGPETAAIHALIARLGLARSVVLLNGISDAELWWAYGNAIALLAPSVLEGFGLPIAEALLAGCPIVCSDIPAFREIGGDRCSYIPLGADSVEGFSAAVVEALRQPVPHPVLLPQYSLPVIAEQYVELYRSLLSTPSSSLSSEPLSIEISGETQRSL